MKERFEELYQMLKRMRKDCPWNRSMEIKTFAKEIGDEAQEVVKAVEKGDIENIKEEIGDVLADTMFLAVLCEEAGHFDIKDSLQEVIDKIKRRKPHVFGDKSACNIEEAKALWKKAKEEEKR